MNIQDIFYNNKLWFGHTVPEYKNSPVDTTCIYNAIIITPSQGMVWYGDVSIANDGDTLRNIATEVGEPLYVLCETDYKSNGVVGSIDQLIRKSLWSTRIEKSASVKMH